MRPGPDEYDAYYAGYVERVPEDGILPVLRVQAEGLLGAVAPERERFRYAPGKWTVREVAGHMVDAERLFGFRAFCFSRGEPAPLPSFDEDAYVAASRYAEVPLAELLEEFAAVRRANLMVLSRLSEADWGRAGTASGRRVTVRALAYLMAGHARHHASVLAERYGVPLAKRAVRVG